MFRSILLLTGLSIATLPQAAAGQVVATTDHFELRSNPRVALHHFLLAWAAADADEWPGYALPLREREDWRSVLNAGEQEAWSRALATYGTAVGRSLLFDGGMLAVRAWAAGAAPPSDVPADDRALVDAVNLALPIYERHWWQNHDREIRAWIGAVTERLDETEERIIARFEAAYGGEWSETLVPVDVIVYANPVGAYSSAERLTLSSRHRGNQMPQSIEMIFHEASHTDGMEGPLRAAIAAAFDAAGGAEPDRFWHDVIFFTSGDITRIVLAEDGDPNYEHYGAPGVYQRGARWRVELPAFEQHWRPFLESGSADDTDRHDALVALVTQVLSGEP